MLLEKRLFFICMTALLLHVALPAQECMECHDDQDLTAVDEKGVEFSLYVSSEKFSSSIHGDFDCVDCHADIDEIPHQEAAVVECASCHDEAATVYAASIHAKGNGEGATCVDCHGKHDILSNSDPASKMFLLNQAETCAVCHSRAGLTDEYGFTVKDPLAAYKQSVHGLALLSEKNFDAATCVSCHGGHDIRPLGDPESPIYWQNIMETCGGCHGEMYEQYAESVHGRAVKKGVRDAPVCNDCHGEHSVHSTKDPNSSVHPLRVSAQTCERCHNSELMNARYSIASDRVATFENSYHGLAIKGGSLAAANCASCHGVHNILPSSDPASLIHPANLQNTCGKCHENMTENLVKGSVHLTSNSTPGIVVLWVKNIYLSLIVIVIGFMFLHNTADFIRKSRRKISERSRA